ncbi:zinc transporter ZIP10-like [Acipenser ruthenus]|uniref:zinc transporter ZIP10-like n=1 Tax=Acipenser ruthenus TaxID=7906 RepID=UPI00145BD974|nr:zinc transporter ZIP10-like [Acipenser ruthenus]XP_058888467.1 zinc transporter ZIP10-like [Acipenser ruthenus]XP_058888468.1 zinc transporter ZIP10-like [Acipenser ruthenus]XP_058888469.1 zinc transporter ZIP10-like [Acipenser ruthenus]
MKVHMHTKFCFLCVVTFLFHQCSHCHKDGHHHDGEGDHVHDHNDYQISQEPYMQNSVDIEPPPDHDSPSGKEAESEQKFYIEQLFRRYGDRGKLNFGGFKKLLSSLGLGEVHVVEMDHEDLGHDHVAHLDALEVQEGLHSHTHHHPPTPLSHSHTHSNQEENKTSVRGVHSARCNQSQQRTAGPTPTGHSHEDHNHLHKLHSHYHNHTDSPIHHHHSHHHHHHVNHSVSGSRVTAEASQSLNSTHQQQQQQSTETATRKHRKKKKGIRNKDAAPQAVSPHEGDHHSNESQNPHLHAGDAHTNTDNDEHASGHKHSHEDEHAHVRKREAPNNHKAAAKRTVPFSLGDHLAGEAHLHDECLNVTQLLEYYGFSPSSLISQEQFTYLCPALLYQIDSRACIRHSDELAIDHKSLNESALSAWVWGLLSITIISLLSLLGVILVPISNQSCFKFLLTFLVALAVGTLSGDALLHLLPHSQGGHDHSHEGGKGKGEHEQEDSDYLTQYNAVWKGLTALGGIYLLFIIEHCIGMFKHYKDKGGNRSWCWKKKKGDETTIGRKLSDHKRRSDAEWLNLKPLTGPGDSALSDNKHNNTQLTELQGPPDSPNKRPLSPEEGAIMLPQHEEHKHHHQEADFSAAAGNGRKVKTKKHHHSHGHGHSHGNCHSDQEMKDAGIASIAWMVIMGDGMHNFSDGLAIGAAFSAGLTGGISTSIAVFCHELPHELGDFAVLLKAGMSVRQAIVYNLLSALMAYVGMVIGTAVGQYTDNLTPWIFAVTAGMFLYVALVDMLPEMLHGNSEELQECPLGYFLLQNMGLLVGFGIMLLIAIFEDKIVLDIQF